MIHLIGQRYKICRRGSDLRGGNLSNGSSSTVDFAPAIYLSAVTCASTLNAVRADEFNIPMLASWKAIPSHTETTQNSPTAVPRQLS
jgi:hypothetical protein